MPIPAHCRAVLILCALGLALPARNAFADEGKSIPAANHPFNFPSTAPMVCPFPPSTTLAEPLFTGRNAEYEAADTWYPSWASDGNLYSPWTDGVVEKVHSSSEVTNGCTTGYARIIGDDPLNLKIVDVATYHSDPTPYDGRYPCGTLVYNGNWFYGTYCLGPKGSFTHEGQLYNYPWLGPFVGFRWSTDFGKTWTQTPCTPAAPLFGENGLNGEPVKIGSPHFVDFGRNMEHSPDGKAYLVAHGASDGKNRRFAYDSWITGDEIYLIRVTPAIETMNDASKYEFFAGKDAQGQDLWTHDFAKIKPITQWRDHLGCVTMTYDAPLKKYLMCITDGGNTVGDYNTMILESDTMTGPFKRMTYWKSFGVQGYFVNLPSKFISADGKTCWLSYAANFVHVWLGKDQVSNPPGGHYAWCLQEIKLRFPADPVALNPNESSIAPKP